jgi:hypothetical protein
MHVDDERSRRDVRKDRFDGSRVHAEYVAPVLAGLESDAAVPGGKFTMTVAKIFACPGTDELAVGHEAKIDHGLVRVRYLPEIRSHRNTRGAGNQQGCRAGCGERQYRFCAGAGHVPSIKAAGPHGLT